MKKVLLGMVILVLACGSAAQAAVMNPETFETYSEGAWTPTDNGWYMPAGTTATIVNDGGNKVLYTENVNGDNSLHGFWYVTGQDPTGVVTLSYDANMKARGDSLPGGSSSVGHQVRWGPHPSHTNGNWTPAYTYVCDSWAYSSVDGVGFVGPLNESPHSMNAWYSYSIEMDFANGRARVGAASRGSALVYEDWTDVTVPDPWAPCQVWVLTRGGVQFDNFSLTPEPATMIVLAIGGVMALLRRKRQ